MNRIVGMPRTLNKDGVNLGCKVMPETKDQLRTDARHQAKRLGHGAAELRGAAYVVNSLICWYLKQDKSERARIVDVGRPLFDRLLASDEDGAEVPAVIGPLNEGLDRPAQTPRRRKASGSDGRKSG